MKTLTHQDDTICSESADSKIETYISQVKEQVSNKHLIEWWLTEPVTSSHLLKFPGDS